MLAELKIDEKWTIVYDPSNNNKPVHWLRYGVFNGVFNGNNAHVAMFYALLEASRK